MCDDVLLLLPLFHHHSCLCLFYKHLSTFLIMLRPIGVMNNGIFVCVLCMMRDCHFAPGGWIHIREEIV